MDEKYRKLLAGFLVIGGLIQAIGGFSTQNYSIVSLAMILGGIAFALAGVLFWFEI